ncbi:MAG: DUF1638 domain-containing protein [Thermodesulfobacteriota bacterium]
MNTSIQNFSIKAKDDRRLLILACSVMEKEIRQFQNGQVEFKFFDYGLHRTPENMAKTLQEEIDQVSEENYDGIILGYGLCSNGIVGVRSQNQTLIIPRIHDCISLFLGSPESYKEEAKKHPGTYYLTPGWIEKGETPISKYEDYAKSYDEETAKWVLHEEMKHYKRIAFIDTGVYPAEPYRKIARQNAEFLGINYEEPAGSPLLFKELVCGPWGKNFLILEKGQSIQQEMFLDL